MVKPIQVNPITPSTRISAAYEATLTSGSASFADVLAEKQSITFSKHAQNRLERRDINLGDDGLARLEEAVTKAEKRGAQESLILMDDMAFIVNVKNRMVVTAMDAGTRGEGVFTNIDSVVLANSEKTEDK
jgi:flagellar operon protein